MARKHRSLRRKVVRLAVVFTLAAVLLSATVVLPWRWIAPPTTAFMIRARVVEGVLIDHEWTPWGSISPNLAMAAVAAEDQKFPFHHGFDLAAIQDALGEARAGGVRGASTISQQVAKNLYLWPARSLIRKGLEAYLTVWIEALWPKRRILEVYLNVAEFGPGVFGVGAASRRAFGKRPSALTLEEAATLIAVLPSPRRMSIEAPSEYVRRRSAEIATAARRLGGPAHLSSFAGE